MAPSGRPPVVFDDFVHALGRASTPTGALVLTLLAYLRNTQLGWKTGPLQLVREKKYLTAAWIFVILKALSGAASRLALNHGWKRDRPNWRSPKEVVVITGGARGIGGGFVDLLAKKTKRIAVIDMSEPSYKAQGVKYYKCDITNRERVKEVAEQIRKDLGHPTVLINNAGIAGAERILDYTEERFLKTYQINILGAIFMLQEFLPNMIKNNHGHVQMMASMSAYMSVPQLTEYCCTKSAAVALHECLSLELVSRYNAPRVRTSLICPNKVSTDLGNHMAPNAMEFFNPTLTIAEVNKCMLGHIESGLSGSSVLPTTVGGLTLFAKALPAWFAWEVRRQGQIHRTITDDSIEKGQGQVQHGSVLQNGTFTKARKYFTDED